MHSTTPLRVYSIADPALDLIEMGRDATRYLHDRDPSRVKIREGRKPVVFQVRRIDSDVFGHFVQSEPEHRRGRAAFRFAVASIADLESHANGQPFRLLEPDETQQAFGRAVSLWSDERLEHVAPAYIEEIGELAYMRSFLPRESAACLQPPRSSLVVLAGRISSLVAEQTAALHRLRTSGELPAPTSAKAGDTATGARAGRKASKPRKAKKPPRKPPAKRKPR